MINKKYIMIFVVLFPVFIMELFIFYPSLFYLSISLVNLAFFLAFYFFSNGGFFNKRSLIFLIFPVLLTNSLIVFISILTNGLFIQFLIFFNFLFMHHYVKQYYRDQILKVEGVKWVSFSSYISFLIIFFSSSSIYGLNSLLSFSVWSLACAMMLVFVLTTYQSFYFNKISQRRFMVFILFICFISVEILWTLFFLPFSYYVLGLILAICYYVIIGVTKLFLKESVDRRKVGFFLLFGGFSIFLVILTAKIL